ncbi:MAG: AI-2E family transporter [Oscillospiraceae bacterium]|nr:AI-2E family transporter [Oscillospiraceae bacterium]
MNIDKKTIRNLFLIAAGCICFYFILNETEKLKAAWSGIMGLLSPFMLGAAIAFILNVPMRGIEGKLSKIKSDGLRRATAILLTLLSFVVVIVGVVLLLIPQIGETFEILIPKIVSFFQRIQEMVLGFLRENPDLLNTVSSFIDLETLDLGGIIEKVMNMLGNSMSSIANSALSMVGGITGALVDGVIGLVFAFYCLASKETLARQGRKLLYAFLPERISDETLRILSLTNRTFSSFISGQCVEACILGGMFAVAMVILRMPYVTLISVLIAVTALVPLVGGFIGCFFGAFFILVNNPMQALIFVIVFLVLQQIEGNLIYPKVVGSSIGLPGMWVLAAVTIGGDLMGVVGMFLMIPLSSVLYTLLREITNKRLAMREIAPEKLGKAPDETE